MIRITANDVIQKHPKTFGIKAEKAVSLFSQKARFFPLLILSHPQTDLKSTKNCIKVRKDPDF